MPLCESEYMERDRILRILREHEEELRAAGLLHLRLFGSVARGEETPGSDVDLLFEYDGSDDWNLMRAYGSQNLVAAMLSSTAHLSSALHLRPEFRNAVLDEAIDAF